MQNKIAIVGGGELAHNLIDQLSLSAQIELIDVRYRRQQGFTLAASQLAKEQLLHATIVVNLLLTGKDFLNIGVIKILPPETIIVDFGRPSIKTTSHRIVIGNRLVHPSIHFWPPLPGGWQSNEIPACSLPCILASFGDSCVIKNIRDFSVIARFMKFQAIATKGNDHA